MLAGAALAYLRRYGVAVGRRPVLFTNNDEAYQAALALHAAGIRCAGIIDARERSPAADRARVLGIEVQQAARVRQVLGRHGVRGVVAGLEGGGCRTLSADSLLMSGGYSPLTALATQLGATARWREDLAAFSAELDPKVGALAGAVRGVAGLAAGAQDGERAAQSIASSLGRTSPDRAAAPLPADSEQAPLSALWEVRGPGKAFVDLQNDVTADDVRLARREGYEHVEHMKRYTTHGMATDQGRIGGLVGSAVLAQARGLRSPRSGCPSPGPIRSRCRSPRSPAGRCASTTSPNGACRCTSGMSPPGRCSCRRVCGCGRWCMRARAAGMPVLAEARAVRAAVGITEVSSLGKIDVQGAGRRALPGLHLRQHLLDARRSDAPVTASCCARTA